MAKVYLGMTDGVNADVSFLKRKTGYSSAGVYKILNSLIDKGFVGILQNTYPRRFFAVSLDKIASKIANEGRKFSRMSEKLKMLSKQDYLMDRSEIYEDTPLTDYYLNIPYKVDDNFMWCTGSFSAVKDFLGIDVEKEFVNKRVRGGLIAML